MKISSTFHVLVFLMAVLTFSLPFTTLAQQNSLEAEAMAAAAADANRDVNKRLWFGGGFLLFWAGACCLLYELSYTHNIRPAFLLGCSSLLPSAGLAGSYFYRPDPPAMQLVGKSPEYIAAYTSTYKSERGNIQAKWASAGCLGGGVVVVGGLIYALSVALSAFS